MRFVLGLCKGLAAGGAAGFLGYVVNAEGVLAYLVAGLAAAFAGIVCGKAPWKHDTFMTPALKGLVGFGVGAALYFGWSRLPLGAVAALAQDYAPVVPPAVIGVLYGLFVEIDDGGAAAPKPDAIKRA